MESITSLASKWLHASCSVKICEARAYLEAVYPLLGWCSCWYRRVSTTVGLCGAIIVTLDVDTVTGEGDGTLGDGAVMGPGNGTLCVGAVIVDIVGRDIASIFCRVLMAWNWLSPIDNGDAGSRFMIASVKSSTALRASSAEDSLGTGQSLGKNYAVLVILFARMAGTYVV